MVSILKLECTTWRNGKKKTNYTCEQWSKPSIYYSLCFPRGHCIWVLFSFLWYPHIRVSSQTARTNTKWNITIRLAFRRSSKTSYTLESKCHNTSKSVLATSRHPPQIFTYIVYPPLSLLNRGIDCLSHTSSPFVPTIRPLVLGISPYRFKIQNSTTCWYTSRKLVGLFKMLSNKVVEF